MKIIVNEFPKTKGDCIFKRICPIFEFCDDTSKCEFMQLSTPKEDAPLGEKVRRILINDLNADPELSGFEYTVNMIKYIDETGYSRTKNFMSLHEIIANQNGHTTKQGVERSIRHMVSKILDTSDYSKIELIFGKKYAREYINIPTKRFIYGLYEYAKYIK